MFRKKHREIRIYLVSWVKSVKRSVNLKTRGIVVIATIFCIGFYLITMSKTAVNKEPLPVTEQPIPTPTIELPFGIYTSPKIPRKDSYRIVMVGDSMTAAFGNYGGKLSEDLNKLYQSTPGNQRIVVDNYAKGATNILDLHNQLTATVTNNGLTLNPLISVQPDLILIESFGYNPLSQFGLTEGQKRQTQTLDETMKFLTKTLPNAQIIFVATIAPNKETYALQENKGIPREGRIAQAEERMAYIKNHIAFANTHNIPLIDIYNKSLTKNGDGNLQYINPNDHIHPSISGIEFISNEIANFIYDNQILPR